MQPAGPYCAHAANEVRKVSARDALSMVFVGRLSMITAERGSMVSQRYMQCSRALLLHARSRLAY